MERQKVMLVTDDSPLGIVPFNSAVFSKRSVGVAFHDNGSLSEVTNESTSGLAAAFDSLSGAPASVASALEGVEKIRSAASTLDNAGVNSAIAKLENEKKLVEAKIGLSNTTATAEMDKLRTKLQAAIDLLKTRRELGEELAKFVTKS
ncbi:MAG: hypothetical protein KJO18_00320 [Acidimicrobiia bacterium]|nr:hypothetical protein [Acidimicrobiia bacterium]